MIEAPQERPFDNLDRLAIALCDLLQSQVEAVLRARDPERATMRHVGAVPEDRTQESEQA